MKRFQSQRFHFVCLALSKLVLLPQVTQDILKSLLLSLLPLLRPERNNRRHFGTK